MNQYLTFLCSNAQQESALGCEFTEMLTIFIGDLDFGCIYDLHAGWEVLQRDLLYDCLGHVVPADDELTGINEAEVAVLQVSFWCKLSNCVGIFLALYTNENKIKIIELLTP